MFDFSHNTGWYELEDHLLANLPALTRPVTGKPVFARLQVGRPGGNP